MFPQVGGVGVMGVFLRIKITAFMLKFNGLELLEGRKYLPTREKNTFLIR